MTSKVVIIGGGIGGLSAAHELIERGFAVEVYEARAVPGGKARSIPVRGTGMPGPHGMRKDLPGEHGFRFFPLFYKHVIDTMARIPYGPRGTVADNLVEASRVELARFDRPPLQLPCQWPKTLSDLQLILQDLPLLSAGHLGPSHEELAYFASRIWQIVTSCAERRNDEYEKIGWWEFIGAEQRSEEYQKLLGHGLTRSLVAAKQLASTKTIGNIFVQLLQDILTPTKSMDRLLNGPTSDVWITPWLEYLQASGVRYHASSRCTGITCSQGRIQNVTFADNAATRTAQGDWYIFAVPIEQMVKLLTPSLVAADPALEKLHPLAKSTEWMNGIQFYLTEDLNLPHGHTIFVDSPWALTSVNQSMFWQDIDLSQYGDGSVKDIISIDVSDWENQGLNGKTAKECTIEELRLEVWNQLKRSWNYGETVLLRDELLQSWFLDPGVSLSAEDVDTNEEPLLVNLVNTWALRPEATTRIPNMFLAADYVRTFTDLATMESANEAARRAVNGILSASGVQAPPCRLWELQEPEIFAPFRQMDAERYRRGLPWDDRMVSIGLSGIQLTAQTLSTARDALTKVQSMPGMREGIRAAEVAGVLPTEPASDALDQALLQFSQRVAELSAFTTPATVSTMTANIDRPDRGQRARSGKVRIIPQ